MELEKPGFAESVAETVGDRLEEGGKIAVALGFALCVIPFLIKSP